MPIQAWPPCWGVGGHRVGVGEEPGLCTALFVQPVDEKAVFAPEHLQAAGLTDVAGLLAVDVV